MSQSLILYLSIGAAVLAVSFLKILLNKKVSNPDSSKYWMTLGKTIDLQIYRFVCSVIIPLLILINIDITKDTVVYIAPILLIAILVSFDKRDA